MNVALDLCSNRMRSLYLKEEMLKNRSIRAAYAIFPDDADIRDAFRQLKIPFAILDGRLMVYGDYAHRAGRMFGSPVIPLFPEGELPRTDPPRRQLVSHMLELLLPKATGDDDICMMTVPGEWNIDSTEFQKTTEYLKRLVKLKNYQPIAVNPGLAAAFAELGSDQFTGLCITAGDTHTYYSLLLQAREVLSFAIPQATQWFLQEIARKTECHIWNRDGEKLLDVEGVANVLSNGQAMENELSKAVESSLNCLLRHFFQRLSTHLMEISEDAKKEIKSISLPIVLTGDLVTLIPSLGSSVEKVLEFMNFPFEVERIGVAKNPEHSVTRGCLICAELERNASISAAA